MLLFHLAFISTCCHLKIFKTYGRVWISEVGGVVSYSGQRTIVVDEWLSSLVGWNESGHGPLIIGWGKAITGLSPK
ncbi:hypothetical protein QQP08_027460 [Theobroma cacao]|nr:hypothetical protein QQP08_027460 [Theobroma cacao]